MEHVFDKNTMTVETAIPIIESISTKMAVADTGTIRFSNVGNLYLLYNLKIIIVLPYYAYLQI